MTKHYVEFIYHGIITSESVSEEVDHRDPHRIDPPENAVQFHFFDREEGEMNGRLVRSAPFNYSAEYYPGGVILSRDEVDKLYPSETILRDNMRFNKLDRIVRNRLGGFLWPPHDREMVALP